MYYYLVDPSQYDGKNFEFFQTQLLSLLGEYHISGEVARVTRLRTVEDLAVTAISHGITTLVVVGGDSTFNRVAGTLAGKKITLGYIPLNGQSEIARIVGVAELVEAVATIAKRRIEILDLGRLGDNYFISTVYFGPGAELVEEWGRRGKTPSWRSFLELSPVEIEISINGQFKVKDKILAGAVINASDRRPDKKLGTFGDPKDQRLDIVLASKLGKFQILRHRRIFAQRAYESLPGASLVHAATVEILAPTDMPLYVSGIKTASAPGAISVAEEKIRLIVGRGRPF